MILIKSAASSAVRFVWPKRSRIPESREMADVCLCGNWWLGHRTPIERFLVLLSATAKLKAPENSALVLLLGVVVILLDGGGAKMQ